jgi:hypothetical protein
MAARKQSPGAAMVAAILAEMTEAGVEPDAKERALLVTARQIVDRLDALEAIIARDGEMLTSATGIVRVHPAVPEHRQQAVSLPKVLSGIVVGDSSAGKNPTKQAAAQTRWRSHNIAKAEQAGRVS